MCGTEHMLIMWIFFSSASGRVLWHVHGQIPRRQDGQVESETLFAQFLNFSKQGDLYQDVQHCLPNQVKMYLIDCDSSFRSFWNHETYWPQGQISLHFTNSWWENIVLSVNLTSNQNRPSKGHIEPLYALNKRAQSSQKKNSLLNNTS